MKHAKILIVEDELLIAENLAIKLKTLEYQVVDIVSSGKAALEKVELHNPDLILMDIAIKGKIDGIQTAQAIRKKHDVAIIFLTAYADDQTLDRATFAGCYGYIIKPFKDRELHATIKVALKKHQEQIGIQQSLTEITELLGEYSAEKNHVYEDKLTKLPNQLMLQDLFSYLVAEANNSFTRERSKGVGNQSTFSKRLLSVAYIKLYKFERIVASLDNDCNNSLIQLIASRFAEAVEEFKYQGATLKLASSDFCILLSGLENRQVASNFFESILDKLCQPFIINHHKIFVTASIGISFYPFDNLAIDRLLEQAKQAMLYAENQGSNKYQLYTSAFRIMNSNISGDLSLEADLHQALEREELELYYQPKISVQTGKIHSAEALLRWNHPQLGIIAPNKIIPLAEATGLMDKIDKWVLRKVCHQIKIWHRAKFDFLKVAVNLSGHQFKQSDLFHQLTTLLFELNINPNFLELELTEQVLVESIKSNIQRLNSIKNLGVQISLDDFGTGYSSLGYLHQFPFDILKIDRCFISNINSNTKNATITQFMIEMAHKLNLKVVAEGVETQGELDFLIEHKCDEVQGYLFSYPLTVRDFEKLLNSNRIFIKSSDCNSDLSIKSIK
ncbi:EAL domain-containing protein [Waterburya agarophytonicola K14]|uniref:EAL domain-containing protein n=1 Tax=Waterburya agarophytonicola KI4 TaxID=2874699 RepID=A0A964BT40_9CYAN|nr:EAL domain-containing protein [Waterburya agarophytonicola]MCC0178222.1 EAL domain-containing protein [Waterburya agarophytonicola KI4]